MKLCNLFPVLSLLASLKSGLHKWGSTAVPTKIDVDSAKVSLRVVGSNLAKSRRNGRNGVVM